MANLLRTGFIFIAMLLAGCGWDGTPTRSNDFVPLTAISITAERTTIAAHTSIRLTATGSYAGLFTRDITDQVVWASKDTTIADFVTAAQPNRVTGLAAGPADLTATLGAVSSATPFVLSVNDVSLDTLTVTPSDTSLAKGLSRQFTATGTFSDKSTQDLTFDCAWTSSDLAIATFGTTVADKGLARAGTKEGKATLRATFATGTASTTGSTTLIVTPAVLQAIVVTPAAPTLLSISRQKFTATGSYSDGSTADLTSQATWRSGASDIATFTAIGSLRTLTPGSVSISATLGTISGSTSVKVTGGSLTGITLTPANPILVKGTKSRLTATGTFTNGSRDITAAVDWSVDIAGVADIATPAGNQAWLNARQQTAGARIKASVSATNFAETPLTVVALRLQSLALVPTTRGVTAGTNTRLTAIATFEGNTTQDVTASSTWSSDAPGIATVGDSTLFDKGRVTGVAAGLANITASYDTLTTTKTLITVTERSLQDLTINGATTLAIGKQVAFTATARYSDGSSEDVTVETAWSIDKPTVATLADPVSQPGEVIMVDGGFATLTATFRNKEKTVTLTTLGQ